MSPQRNIIFKTWLYRKCWVSRMWSICFSSRCKLRSFFCITNKRWDDILLYLYDDHFDFRICRRLFNWWLEFVDLWIEESAVLHSAEILPKLKRWSIWIDWRKLNLNIWKTKKLKKKLQSYHWINNICMDCIIYISPWCNLMRH